MTHVLTLCSGRRAHKIYRHGADPEPYDLGYLVRASETEVKDLDDLHDLLLYLEDRPRECLLRGRPRSSGQLRRAYRDDPEKGEAGFVRADRSWFCVDLDGAALPEGADPRTPWRWLDSLLPEPLRGVPAILQYSGSQGVKPGVYAHVWVLTDRAVDDRSLKAWLKSCGVIDLSLYQPVQPHYVARPRFEGMGDPCPTRLYQRGYGVLTLPECVVDQHTYEAQLSALREAERAAAEALKLTGLQGAGYARAALRSAIERVVCAPQGARHTTLRDEAWATARFVRAGELSESEWRSALSEAGRAVLPVARHAEVDRLLDTAIVRSPG